LASLSFSGSIGFFCLPSLLFGLSFLLLSLMGLLDGGWVGQIREDKGGRCGVRAGVQIVPPGLLIGIGWVKMVYEAIELGCVVAGVENAQEQPCPGHNPLREGRLVTMHAKSLHRLLEFTV
jgi:hypothetical protein